MRRLALFICLAAASTVAGATAKADAVSDFYHGKQIRMFVGDPAGSGYDVIGRLLARHFSQHMPGNPTLVPENMEGGASLKLTNYMYRDAARDGLSIASVHRAAVFDPLLDMSGAQLGKFDAAKFGYLGSIGSTVTVGAIWAGSGVTNFEQLRQREIVASTDAPSSDSYVFSHLLNKLMGTKLKIVTGYAGTAASFLAMEEGETSAYFGAAYSSLMAVKPDWVRDHKVNLVIQIGLQPDPRLPNVPMLTSFANDDQKKILSLILAPQQIARPFITPPGVDPARLHALQQAFMDTMSDPAFIAEAQKLSVDVGPMDGQAVHDFVVKTYQAPPATVKLAREALAVDK